MHIYIYDTEYVYLFDAYTIITIITTVHPCLHHELFCLKIRYLKNDFLLNTF